MKVIYWIAVAALCIFMPLAGIPLFIISIIVSLISKASAVDKIEYDKQMRSAKRFIKKGKP